MSPRAIGWAFVGVQVGLLVTLVILPARTDFPLPQHVRTLADIVFWLGVSFAVVAGLTLGRSLTATPVPTTAGTLRTSGVYALARHPIYTGVILIVAAMAVRSRSFISVAVAVATLGFFHLKAVWEEHQLTAVYPGYPAYAARTPRFIPSPRRRRRPRH